MKIGITALLFFAIAFASVARAAAPVAGNVGELGWLTGTWNGVLGESALEETWSQPRGGSMAALVRFIGPETHLMYEIVVIEQVDATLQLRVLQWLRGLKPLTDQPQMLPLTRFETGRATFTAEGPLERGIRQLDYRRTGDRGLVIGVTLAEGDQFDVELERIDPR